MPNNQNEIELTFSVGVLANVVREAIGEGFQWAVRCQGAPGTQLLAQQSFAISALDNLEMIADDAERLRAGIQEAVEMIQKTGEELERKEMEGG